MERTLISMAPGSSGPRANQMPAASALMAIGEIIHRRNPNGGAGRHFLAWLPHDAPEGYVAPLADV